MRKTSLGSPILKIAIRKENDVVNARQKTRRLSQLLGFENQDQIRISTVVSELARNVFQYASSGTAEFFLTSFSPQTLYVKVTDSGPGIEDLDAVLDGTYVSQSGMGVGLSGSKKLMEHFDIETSSKGTTVTIGKEFSKRAKPITKKDLAKISDELAASREDMTLSEVQNQNRELLHALEKIRESEAAMTELNRELAETNRGVVALYAELDEKAASLQKANEVKTSFLSNMTHEFRTPLTSVISLATLLLNGTDGTLSSEQAKQVTYIKKSSESLLELVSNLLDLAKVEAGKVVVKVSEFPIEEVLGGLRGMFRPLTLNSNVEIKVAEDVDQFELKTDLGKLSQVLRNLVSNAIKFTEEGSVTVDATLERQNVHFTVTDTGIGIEKQFIETIFEDYSQVDSPLHNNQRGTGLGLPLSRKLARLLGGELWVESEIGKGSVFHLEIPRNYGGEEEAVLIESGDRVNLKATSTSDKFSVLIVDDDEPSRYVLKDLVRRELDANFYEEVDGAAGYERLRKQIPDLVFLDLAMPKIDGFTLLRTLRLDDNLKNVPIIVNTAKKLSAEETHFIEERAAAVLSKDRPDHQVAIKDLRHALQKAGFDYVDRRHH